ncbi:MAG: hypothetical protein ACLP5H_10870 [Desulfomonilaceae bacterium]
MIREGKYLESLVSEYEGLLLKGTGSESSVAQENLRLVADALCRDADWTKRGADEIARLVKDYGAFMLRNALAVAIVLGKEDGNLGL